MLRKAAAEVEKEATKKSKLPRISSALLFLCVVALFVRVELINSRLEKTADAFDLEARKWQKRDGRDTFESGKWLDTN